MLSRRTWMLIAVVIVGFSLWDAAQQIEIFKHVRYTEDAVIETGITCGYGFQMVFLSRFDDDVPGPATAAECLKSGRTKVAEVLGLWLLAVGAVYVGVRYGREPPVPIGEALPPLPKELPRAVEGRSRSGR